MTCSKPMNGPAYYILAQSLKVGSNHSYFCQKGSIHFLGSKRRALKHMGIKKRFLIFFFSSMKNTTWVEHQEEDEPFVVVPIKILNTGAPAGQVVRAHATLALAWQCVACSSPVHDDLYCMSLPFSPSHFPVYLHYVLSIKAKKPKTNL